MIATRPSVADLYQRQASVEDIQRQLRLDHPHCAEKEIEIRKQDTCDKCQGVGSEAGSRAVNCPTCGGRGQVISSRGFFQVSQTCPRCRGVGKIIEKPCRVCDGEGRVEKASRVKLKIPAGISNLWPHGGDPRLLASSGSRRVAITALFTDVGTTA